MLNANSSTYNFFFSFLSILSSSCFLSFVIHCENIYLQFLEFILSTCCTYFIFLVYFNLSRMIRPICQLYFLVNFLLLRLLSSIHSFYVLASFTLPCSPFLHDCLYSLCAHNNLLTDRNMTNGLFSIIAYNTINKHEL